MSGGEEERRRRRRRKVVTVGDREEIRSSPRRARMVQGRQGDRVLEARVMAVGSGGVDRWKTRGGAKYNPGGEGDAVKGIKNITFHITTAKYTSTPHLFLHPNLENLPFSYTPTLRISPFLTPQP